jgi:L-fucose mutarotase
MLKSKLLHPQINAALGRAGHSSKVLISDGNFPHWTRKGPNAEVVYLNLAPGKVTVPEVLQTLIYAIPIEAVEIMNYAVSGPSGLDADPPVWSEFDQLLKAANLQMEMKRVERFKFYDLAQSPDVCLAIATGEQRIYANILLTIGTVR